MPWSDDYERLDRAEREELRRVVGRLLSQTFLVRSDDDRRDFYYVERNQALISDYLSVMGWKLVVSRPDGVAHVIGGDHSMRLNLRQWESILLLVLRLLYEEKQQQLNLGQVVCRVEDVQAKCLALQLTKKGVFGKQDMRDSLALFRRHSLLKLLGPDVTDPECRFVIYPSIKYAVPTEQIQAIYDLLNAYKGRGEEAEDEAPDRD